MSSLLGQIPSYSCRLCQAGREMECKLERDGAAFFPQSPGLSLHLKGGCSNG